MTSIERKVKSMWHFMLALIASAVLTSNLALAAEAGKESYQDMPVGFTDDGYPFVGNSNATVTLEEWSDYLCPFCGRHFS